MSAARAGDGVVAKRRAAAVAAAAVEPWGEGGGRVGWDMRGSGRARAPMLKRRYFLKSNALARL